MDKNIVNDWLSNLLKVFRCYHSVLFSLSSPTLLNLQSSCSIVDQTSSIDCRLASFSSSSVGYMDTRTWYSVLLDKTQMLWKNLNLRDILMLHPKNE
ncbi:unnamed protein product [Lactuca virosa]|uniref:Uncharacterized protein n=1 Tax=Lactuca virosa TaxID=75947 RepID=A0AAU9PKS1_9ASTR|nr:unnamed protein product [Lactuca virosa]